MLFVLGQALADTINDISDKEIRGLEYLALGVREGNHLMTGGRAILRKFVDSARLTDLARKTFDSAANSVGQFGGLQYKVTVIGHVVGDEEAEVPSATVNNSVRTIRFPVGWFDHSAKIQPTILLGENLSDAFILRWFGEVAMHLDGWGWVLQNCDERLGGGDTTAKVFHHCAMKERVTICVVDSDRGCSSATSGGTATAMVSFTDIANYPISQVIETGGRDLENLLPDSFFRTAYGNVHAVRVACLENLTLQAESEIRLYCDIKKGFSLADLLKLVVGSPEHLFWFGKLNAFAQAAGLDANNLPCAGQNACNAAPPAQCTCVIFPPQSGNILEDFLRRHHQSDRYAIASKLDNSVRGEWLRIGKTIASWCCAANTLRV